MDRSHLNAQDNLGKTPLVLACNYSNEEAARILLRCGADPNIKDRSKRVPLHYAAQRSLSIVQALVESTAQEQLSNLLETTDVRGRTAPYFAIEFTRWDVLAYLCTNGLFLGVRDSLQRTLLHYAAWTGQAETMNVLSVQDLSSIDPVALDCHGQTAEQCFTNLRTDVGATTTETFQRLIAAAQWGYETKCE